MKEIRNIIDSYHSAAKAGKKTALATVVRVEGSSYRRPGARMLVDEDGCITGAISGGCLEGDALKRAQMAIFQQQNKLITYDTTDDDDVQFGVQLGCNGIVHILFEPIRVSDPANPIKMLEFAINERQHFAIATIFSMDSDAEQPGTCYSLADGGTAVSSPFAERIPSVIQDAALSLLEKSTFHKQYKDLNGRVFECFFEYRSPVVRLVIAGAGNDVIPMVEMSSILGWEVIVADGRRTHATITRFPKAAKVLVARPGQLAEQLQPDAQTVFVLMTHNYNYDLELLGLLMGKDYPYIGVLGPKKKLNKMMDALSGQFLSDCEDRSNNIYGPVGLDIGAETAEEIALSILSEIKTVLAHRTASSLRDKINSVHSLDRRFY